jgi:hypothetical protein
MEFIIVTAGVLIALFLSNLKEDIQARKYHKASIETIKKEIKANYSKLIEVIEKQTIILDTLSKYGNTQMTIGEIIVKAGGVKSADLSNTGLDIYKRNQISSIDFEMISMLNRIKNKSEIIEQKLNRLSNFAYKNLLDKSNDKKLILSVHMQDILGSEKGLLEFYKDYIDENIDTKDNAK